MIKLLYSKAEQFNGISAYTNNIYNDLIKSGFDVKISYLPKVEVKIMGKRLGGWRSMNVLSFVTGRSEIVHSMTYWLMSPYTNVVTIHDLFHLTQQKQRNINNVNKTHYLTSLKKIERKGIKVIVQTPIVADDVRKFIPEADISIIPSKIFVQDPIVNPYPDDKKLHLITVGAIMKGFNRKHIYELYEWIKNEPDIDLYHIGKIEDIRYLNYANNIHQIGSVDQQTKFNYLAHADKYVFSSIAEGQGYPTMEAMKLNTQVVINDLPEHKFLLGDKPYYFHNKDEFLEMIWKNKKGGLVEQISQYDNWIKKYKTVYEKVLQ
ncbi:group 1 glycosyltransferase [Cuniculiplasma divulgatum]|uniref:Group 1 glycosyltransferase n=2 Tax=Cuniculiplasma divulgatum TaxID=1673428 RepID=A0A1R4A7Y9_9ARCH|nr:group 1 glycosyltransferase [Cuniculiplasma divulgatum]